MATALVALLAVLGAGAALAQDSWAVADQDFPSSMVWDAAANVSVEAENDGTTTWDSDYALVSVQGATEAATEVDTWGLTAVPVVGTVAPGATHLFEFGIVAPPITTLAYPSPATLTSAGAIVPFDCNWILASQYTPTVAMIPTDTSENAITINRFPDIAPGTSGAWAAFWIEQLAGRAPVMVSGYPDGNYAPKVVVARDAMAVFVARAMNLDLPPYQARFPDVPEDYWARPWIEALAEAGIVAGYPDGNYAPWVTVARDAMAVFVARGMAGGDAGIPSGPAVATFPDVPGWDDENPHWAYDYIEYCVAQGIVSGYPDGTYQPGIEVARDAMAVFIWRGFVQPTGTVIVLAGPATTAFDPATTDFTGWSTQDRDPTHAYVAFDALRLDTNLCTPTGPTDGWDVAFDFYAFDPAENEATGDPLATVWVSLDQSQVAAAKAAAMASGDPYLVMSAPIPALDDGLYQLVVRAETASQDLAEVPRKPVFTISEE